MSLTCSIPHGSDLTFHQGISFLSECFAFRGFTGAFFPSISDRPSLSVWCRGAVLAESIILIRFVFFSVFGTNNIFVENFRLKTCIPAFFFGLQVDYSGP